MWKTKYMMDRVMVFGKPLSIFEQRKYLSEPEMLVQKNRYDIKIPFYTNLFHQT